MLLRCVISSFPRYLLGVALKNMNFDRFDLEEEFIVADIGGTNTRFARVIGREGYKYVFDDVKILKGENFDSFEQAFTHYRDGIENDPDKVCIAIAGPISGDQVTMTNLPWSFSIKAIASQFNLQAFYVLNDWEVLAVACSRLNNADLKTILDGTARAKTNKVCIGPGTGLGAAGLVYSHKGWVPVPTEGGHVNAPARTNLEMQIVQAASSFLDYVSAETLISGQGLVNLDRALAMVEDRSYAARTPVEISEAALKAQEQSARDVLDLMCGFLGNVSSNLVLNYSARGGVYLGGGILPRMSDFLKQSSFAENFRSRGVMSHFVEEIPVSLMQYDQMAFLGAAAWLEQQLDT